MHPSSGAPASTPAIDSSSRVTIVGRSVTGTRVTLSRCRRDSCAPHVCVRCVYAASSQSTRIAFFTASTNPRNISSWFGASPPSHLHMPGNRPELTSRQFRMASAALLPNSSVLHTLTASETMYTWAPRGTVPPPPRRALSPHHRRSPRGLRVEGVGGEFRCDCSDGGVNNVAVALSLSPSLTTEAATHLTRAYHETLRYVPRGSPVRLEVEHSVPHALCCNRSGEMEKHEKIAFRAKK